MLSGIAAVFFALAGQASAPVVDGDAPTTPPADASTLDATTPTDAASTTDATSTTDAPTLKPGKMRKAKPYAVTALALEPQAPAQAELAAQLTTSFWASLTENHDLRVRTDARVCSDDACAAAVGGEVVWGSVGKDAHDERLLVVTLHLFEADAERSIRVIRLDAPDEDTLQAQLHEAAYLMVDSVPPQFIPATVVAGGAVAGVGLLAALGAGGVLAWGAVVTDDPASSTSTKAAAASAATPAWWTLAIGGGLVVVGAGLVIGSLP